MAAKTIKTSNVDKHDAANYWKRSQELFQSMRNNLLVENWNAAVIDGVHAAISANDAITVASIGKRSTSSQHLDAVELLRQAIAPELMPDVNRLRKIIHIKSHVEYGPSLIPSKNAIQIVQDVERFLKWAEGVFNRLTT